MVLYKTLESSLDSPEIKAVNPKKSTLNTHWKGWSWSSNTLVTWCEQPTHWKRPWCWERLKAEGEEGNRMRWLDGITDSMDMNLDNSGRWWGTRRCAAVHGVTESWTQLGDWITTRTESSQLLLSFDWISVLKGMFFIVIISGKSGIEEL